MTVKELFKKISRAELGERLDVGAPAISRTVAENKMPASWYLVVQDMCAKAGEPCPDDLFSMKGNAPEQSDSQATA
jgi:hypothetical protein